MVGVMNVTRIFFLDGIGLKAQQGQEWPLHVHRRKGVKPPRPAG